MIKVFRTACSPSGFGKHLFPEPLERHIAPTDSSRLTAAEERGFSEPRQSDPHVWFARYTDTAKWIASEYAVTLA
jgi:hypothetical protein